MRLAWAGFEAWLGENEKDNLTQALTIVKDFVEDISGDKLQELLQMPPYVHIMQLFDHTWTCSEMTMASCRHSGCHMWTWLRLSSGCCIHQGKDMFCFILPPSGL